MEANNTLQSNLSSLEKKYNRCTEDNQRLKWILRTIQQREEILLTHNKCFNSELLKEEKSTGGLSSKNPSHIEILKANTNESFLSSKPYVSETAQSISNEGFTGNQKDPYPSIATV